MGDFRKKRHDWDWDWDCDCGKKDWDWDKKDHKKDFDCCIFPKHPKPKKILLECGRAVEEANFDIGSSEKQVFELAKVVVDTSCLCRPQVKIEFTTEIFFKSELDQNNVNLVLFFDLVKKDSNGNEERLRTFKYNKRWSLEGSNKFNRIVIREPFTITHCTPLDCSDCFTFFVQVRANPSTEFTGIEEVIVNEGNKASIGALAQGICGH